MVKVTPSTGNRILMTLAFNGEQMNVFVRWPMTFALGGSLDIAQKRLVFKRESYLFLKGLENR